MRNADSKVFLILKFQFCLALALILKCFFPLTGVVCVTCPKRERERVTDESCWGRETVLLLHSLFMCHSVAVDSCEVA